MATINFGHGSFTNELWLLGGQLIDRPSNVQAEFATAGKVTLQAIDAAGSVKSSYTDDNPHGGWNGFPITADLSIGQKYQLRFVNASPGKKELKGGQILTKG